MAILNLPKIFSNFRNIETALIFLIVLKLCFNGAVLMGQYNLSDGDKLLALSDTPQAFAQTGTGGAEETVSFPTGEPAVPINMEILETIKKRGEELDAKETALNQKEKELTMLQATIEQKLQKMTAVQKAIERLLTKREDLIDRSIKHLVKVYSSMKPNQAAGLIAKLDKDISIQILGRMKGKSAAKILEKMDPDIAINISDLLAKRKSRKGAAK